MERKANTTRDRYLQKGESSMEKTFSVWTLDPKSWKPISSAPRKRLVLVRGNSHMSTHRTFYVAAYHDEEYRPLDPWRMVDNSSLSDFGWKPTEWMELPWPRPGGISLV